ncbi:MAG: hypothetical protein IJ193_09475 [Bacilli bacterium]|nr:hypothetical protein [Bacilli bacterium]
MNTKFRFLVVLMSLSITLCLMSNTYSRYVADTTGNVEVSFSKWQILVNETDITNGNTSSITLTPVVEENANVKSNKLAPSSKGYFDIDIDPSNVELSFNYNISLSVVNQNMPDIMITKYAILDSDYEEGDQITQNVIQNNTIQGSLNYDKNTENFAFEPMTIRIYFEWYEGNNETMDDDDDTLLGINADTNTLQMQVNMTFEQKLN